MSELPESWIETTLGEVAHWGSGGTPNRGIPEYFGGNIPWFKTGELNEGIVTEAEEYITEAGLNNSSAKIFPKGSVMIAMYGATIGKCGILGVNGSTNQACAVAQPKSEVDAKFLFHYLTDVTQK
jgi:type I restriction enzyme S subunit